jgi:hypothetical protein
MTLQQLAFLCFIAVALGGLLMALLIASGKAVPRGLGPLHGIGGLAGVGLLLAANLQGGATLRAWAALGVLAAGLAGGVLFFVVLFPKRTPPLLIAGHGGLAVLGLCLLYRVAFPA